MNSLNTRYAQAGRTCVLYQHFHLSRVVDEYDHIDIGKANTHISEYVGDITSHMQEHGSQPIWRFMTNRKARSCINLALRRTNSHLAANCGAGIQATTGLGLLMLVNLRLVTYTAIRKNGVRPPVSSPSLFPGLWLQALSFGCPATNLARRSLCSRLLEL